MQLVNARRHDDSARGESRNDRVVIAECRDRDRLEMYRAVLDDVDTCGIARLVQGGKGEYRACRLRRGKAHMRRHAERKFRGGVSQCDARGVGARRGIGDGGDLAHGARIGNIVCPERHGGGHTDRDIR